MAYKISMHANSFRPQNLSTRFPNILQLNSFYYDHSTFGIGTGRHTKKSLWLQLDLRFFSATRPQKSRGKPREKRDERGVCSWGICIRAWDKERGKKINCNQVMQYYEMVTRKKGIGEAGDPIRFYFLS